MRKLTLFFLIYIIYLLPLSAQKINSNYKLHIQKASSAIQIDGAIDEQAWQDAEIATDFFMITPMDTSFANVRTDVRMTYDDENLYLLVENFLALPGPYMVESLRRDFSFGKNACLS